MNTQNETTFAMINGQSIEIGQRVQYQHGPWRTWRSSKGGQFSGYVHSMSSDGKRLAIMTQRRGGEIIAKYNRRTRQYEGGAYGGFIVIFSKPNA